MIHKQHKQVADELVSNAIDSGATNIECIIDTKLFSIEVRDNGFGIQALDLNLIGEALGARSGPCLQNILTKTLVASKFITDGVSYGFRGEALFAIGNLSCLSIVQLSQVLWVHCEIDGVLQISKSKSSDQTYQKQIRFGTCGQVRPCDTVRSDGTTATVTELFRELPVRRVAMIPSAEISAAKHRMIQLALVNPHISFSLFDAARGTRVLHTPKAQTALPILNSWLGAECTRHLIPIRYEDQRARVRIDGFISDPEYLSHSKDLQFVYLNRRVVLKSEMHSVVTSQFSAYRNRRRRRSKGAVGTAVPLQPMFVLMIACPTEIYDVTYLPDKSMVRFTDSKPVLDLLRDGLREFLRVKSSAKHQCDDDSDDEQKEEHGDDTAIESLVTVKRAKAEYVSPPPVPLVRSASFPPTTPSRMQDVLHRNPLRVRQPPAESSAASSLPTRPARPTDQMIKEWKNPVLVRHPSAADRSGCSHPSSGSSTSSSYVVSKEELRGATLVGQVDQRFLLVNLPPRLFLVDQHAADERIRLERLESEIVDEQTRARILQSVHCNSDQIRISAKEYDLLSQFNNEIRYWGWRVQLSKDSQVDIHILQILQCPVVCGHVISEYTALKNYLAQLQTQGLHNTMPFIVREALASKACRGAIMFGDSLDRQEAQSLLAALGECRLPFICAHGRPSLLLVHELSTEDE